jgi:transposase-like protein
MPRHYPIEFRRAACERLLKGESVSALAAELHVGLDTLYRWKKQALIDAGLRPGIKSTEVDELAQALQTIEELEAELAAVKAASALFNGEEAVSPKGGARLPRH